MAVSYDQTKKYYYSSNAKIYFISTLVPATGNTVMPGHIENERFPGQARNSFTLEDLSNGRVNFVHQVQYFTKFL